jgi:transcriptional antiterminator
MVIENGTESVEIIIKAMKENPKITVKELTVLVGLSRRGVEKT